MICPCNSPEVAVSPLDTDPDRGVIIQTGIQLAEAEQMNSKFTPLNMPHVQVAYIMITEDAALLDT